MNEQDYFEQFSGNPIGESELRKAYAEYVSRPFAPYDYVQLVEDLGGDNPQYLARLDSDCMNAYRLSDDKLFVKPTVYKLQWKLYRDMNIRNGYVVDEWVQQLDDH